MRTAPKPWRLIVALASGCLLFVACAPVGAPSMPATPGPAALWCTRHDVGQGIDVIRITLRCTVAGAARDETAFSLKFTLTRDGGQGFTFPDPCAGAIQNGAGSCEASYATIVNFTFGASTVTGELLPSHRALGPVTPALTP